MVTLAFHFPGHRYHATPWGHQVNEGRVEWPASPWRVLRALISSGYTRLGWHGSPPESGRNLLLTLSEHTPCYSVPGSSVAHSRHYMPIGKLRTGSQLEATTLVLDSWANLGTHELQIHWDIPLPVAERELLASLVECMNYLGRSESWVVGRVLDDSETPMPPNTVPHEPGSPLDRHEELVTLMAPVTPAQYQAWRAERVEQGQNTVTGKLTAKQRKEQEKQAAPYPSDLLDALQWDTARWQSFGWSQPPGSQLVQYRRPRDTLSATAQRGPSSPVTPPAADMVLLAIAADSGSAGGLPSVARTLPQAELIHDALVRLACGDGQLGPAELTGRADNGKPLTGHQHAHVLPLDLDNDGRLDHVLLWARMGFSRHALEAIGDLRRTWTKGGQGALRVAMAGTALQSKASSWPEGMDRFVAASRHWTSETPFVAPRFLKRSGTNALEGQIRAELSSRGLPEPVAVRFGMLPPDVLGTERTRSLFRQFVRARSRGGTPPPHQTGWHVELEFEQVVTGPICIGYASHFGLGMMRASHSG